MPELIKYILKIWLLVILLSPLAMLIYIDLLCQKNLAAFAADFFDVLPIMIFTGLLCAIPTLLLLLVLGILLSRSNTIQPSISKIAVSFALVIGIISTFLLISGPVELILIYVSSAIIISLAIHLITKNKVAKTK